MSKQSLAGLVFEVAAIAASSEGDRLSGQVDARVAAVRSACS